MKFLCGSCRTKYQISGEKVRGKILTIRCKKCGSKILVRESLGRESGGGTAVAPVAEEEHVEERTVAAGSGRSGGSAALASAYDVVMGSTETEDMPTSIAPVPANLDRAGVEWYVAVDGVQQGPFAFGELVRRVGSKEVQGRHYVWHDGMDNWQRARDVADLGPYFPNKKKPPPPPPTTGGQEAGPGSGAEVVDFASKRAERQKSLGASVVEPIAASETDATALDSAKAVPPGDGPQPGSDRAEQLDKVLNEALGIRNEDKTARAEPQRTAASASLLSSAGLPPAKADVPSIDDLLAFDQHGDDIFANVPRAADEQIQKESTRFFVAAAGVNRQRSRNRLGLYAGGAGALAVIAFMGAWASGMIEISIPGIGNPFHNAHAQEEPDNPEDFEPEDLTLFKNLDGEQKKAAQAAARKKAAARKAAAAANPAGPSGDYVTDQGSSGGGTGPRGAGDIATVGIGGQMATNGTPSLMPQAELPRNDVDLPTLETGVLSESQIANVINSRKKSVSICYEQSLRGARDDLRGKLEIKVTVEPSGNVSRASVETSQFKGSKLGECIAQKIKDWRFPAFGGEAQTVVVPFVLEKQNY